MSVGGDNLVVKQISSNQWSKVCQFTSPGTKTIHARINADQVVQGSKTISVLPTQITGPSTLCESMTYSVDDLPIGFKVDKWVVSNSLEIVSGQNTNQLTIKPTTLSSYGASEGTITAYIGNKTITKRVSLNTPLARYYNVSLPNKIVTEHEYYNECKISWLGSGDILEYNWSCTGFQVIDHTERVPGDFIRLRPVSPGSTAQILVRARNRCGWGEPALYGREVTRYPTRSLYNIYSDNTGVVFVRKNETYADAFIGPGNYGEFSLNYELYNQATGNLIDKGKMDNSGGTVDFSRFPKGIYIFNLNVDAENRQTHRLIIK
ncbi:MAG: T9SS type A sorting domain-containing protein [Tannerellaceae bacterium]|nr:T9SS type A sorting domain-containing protein [Tannerellaceae bacterium]